MITDCVVSNGELRVMERHLVAGTGIYANELNTTRWYVNE